MTSVHRFAEVSWRGRSWRCLVELCRVPRINFVGDKRSGFCEGCRSVVFLRTRTVTASRECDLRNAFCSGVFGCASCHLLRIT